MFVGDFVYPIKKTEKIPPKELAIAKKRMKAIKNAAP
jgi:phage-related protein